MECKVNYSLALASASEKEEQLISSEAHEQEIESSDDMKISKSAVPEPSLFLIHGALILAQTLFGSGSIAGQLGLSGTNPVLFALLREVGAGPLLCIIAYAKDLKLPLLSDWRLFVGPGLCVFLTQFCFICGLKISSGITAAAWQPSQGILAVLYGYCLGIETYFDRYKIGGILIGTAGALFMILLKSDESLGDSDIWSTFGGSMMFFVNCSATVFYLILGKRAYHKYSSSTLTGVSYILAAFLMLIATIIVANTRWLLDGLCADCHGEAWTAPSSRAIYALLWYIVGCTVTPYWLIMWANQFADPSVNLAYTVLQPVTSVTIAEILLFFGIVSRCNTQDTSEDKECLKGADWSDLGAVGIAMGLYLVIYSSRLQRRAEARHKLI